MNDHYSFTEDQIYHVVNRANGGDQLFVEQDNYMFFLQQYKKYIAPVADTFAYSMLPNHFHFLMRIKPYESLLPLYLANNHKQEKDGWLSPFVLQCFSNFQNSYAKAFNKKYHRMGSLFMHPLKRVLVLSDHQFSATIFYIHKNAVHHGICSSIADWKNCSYPSFLSNAPTLLMREEVLDWFGDIKQFIEFHQQPIHLKNAVILE